MDVDFYYMVGEFIYISDVLISRVQIFKIDLSLYSSVIKLNYNYGIKKIFTLKNNIYEEIFNLENYYF